VLADLNDIDISAMLDHQRAIVDRHATALETDDDDTDDGTDVVRLWRLEATRAARRFIDQLRPDDTG
jgi:hypothetical protein